MSAFFGRHSGTPADGRSVGGVPQTVGMQEPTPVVDVVDAVPDEVLTKVRSICLPLPDASEEPAWVGVRWRIRGKTFAHLYAVEPDSPTILAQRARPQGITVVLVFRAPADEVEAIRAAGNPFFVAGWGRDVVGLVLGGSVDWPEVAELLVQSYCFLAPRKLVAMLDHDRVGHHLGGSGPERTGMNRT